MLGSLSSNFLLGFIFSYFFIVRCWNNFLWILFINYIPPLFQPLSKIRDSIFASQQKSAEDIGNPWLLVRQRFPTSCLLHWLFPSRPRFSQHIYLDHLSVFICLFSPLIVIIEIVKNQLLLKSFFFGINFGFRRLLFS